VFVNRTPRFEPLSEDALDTVDRGWKRLVSELGITFMHEPSLELFKREGQRVEGEVVFFDPDWLLERIKTTPTEFTLLSRNPTKNVQFGKDNMVFCTGQSMPFVDDGVTPRRDGTLADAVKLLRAAQMTPEIDTPGYPIIECNDMPLDSRHLDLQLAMYENTDLAVGAAQIHVNGVIDSIAMAQLALGGFDVLEQNPGVFGTINANSPLVFDTRMLESLWLLAERNQIVNITPFILMGAMGPVSLPAALAQQTAESLAGIALVQAIRPGCPAIMGSFVSNTDMKSGSPGFGGPEAALGILATGQIARRHNLLWRAGGGGLNASPAVDGQSAFESLNTMLPSFLAGANLQLHCTGWLEGGLVHSFAKVAMDTEMLRQMVAQFTPVEFSDETLAFGAHEEVGHGGHFFGAAHTLERFRECFYRPEVWTTDNYSAWTKKERPDATKRALAKWDELQESWEAPELDPVLHAELKAYTDRRRIELGD
jgi:trimethylamine---corrinoid protein Co-methyltransferase